MVDAATVMTQVVGKKLFKGFGLVFPEDRDGKITKEEYTMIEEGIRDELYKNMPSRKINSQRLF